MNNKQYRRFCGTQKLLKEAVFFITGKRLSRILAPLFIILHASFICVAQRPVKRVPPEPRDTVTKGFKPAFGSDPFYIAYIGVAYNIIKQNGRKQPYVSRHTFGLNYSPILNSLHPYYENNFPQALGKWDVSFKLGYDGLRRLNFFGVGNETRRVVRENRFNWMRTRNQYAMLDITRSFATHHRITGSLLYDGIQVLNDQNRFITKSRGTIDPLDFNWQNFLAGRLRYNYTWVDNPLFPFKGIDASASTGYTKSLRRDDHSFARYTADIDTYFPLTSSFSLAIRTGISTVTGTPDFYQYNSIGGTSTLRGYRQWRYFGKTAFYNQNELRWVKPVAKGNITGHAGLVAFYDQGRIWQPGEKSDKMHFGYGAGVIVAPLDRIWVTAVYAISNEDRRTHFTVGASL